MTDPQAIVQFLKRDRQGMSEVALLPRADWNDRYDDIIVDPEIKSDLLSFTLFCLTRKSAASEVRLPLHGIALLAGPPGTGKTTLARGIANRAARLLAESGVSDQTIFAAIDPHAFPRELLGESQRAVARLFDETLPELAGTGLPLVVVVDEVEALAVTRSLASLDTNPFDVHRATDAVLTGLDRLAQSNRQVVLLATTNALDALDGAFVSRVDMIEHFTLPNEQAVAVILRSTLGELRVAVADDDPEFDDLVRCYAKTEVDARQVRKLALTAFLRQERSANWPAEEMTFERMLPELRRAHSQGAAFNRTTSSSGDDRHRDADG